MNEIDKENTLSERITQWMEKPRFQKTVPVLYGLPIALLTIGFIGDVLTTWSALNIHHTIEVNSWLLIEYGYNIWCLGMVALFVVIFFIYDRIYRIHPALGFIILFFPIVIELKATINNILVIWGII